MDTLILQLRVLETSLRHPSSFIEFLGSPDTDFVGCWPQSVKGKCWPRQSISSVHNLFQFAHFLFHYSTWACWPHEPESFLTYAEAFFLHHCLLFVLKWPQSLLWGLYACCLYMERKEHVCIQLWILWVFVDIFVWSVDALLFSVLVWKETACVCPGLGPLQSFCLRKFDFRGDICFITYLFDCLVLVI